MQLNMACCYVAPATVGEPDRCSCNFLYLSVAVEPDDMVSYFDFFHVHPFLAGRLMTATKQYNYLFTAVKSGPNESPPVDSGGLGRSEQMVRA